MFTGAHSWVDASLRGVSGQSPSLLQPYAVPLIDGQSSIAGKVNPPAGRVEHAALLGLGNDGGPQGPRADLEDEVVPLLRVWRKPGERHIQDFG